MRILLITPLYPPDIADPAPYVKELAMRLSRSHTVSVLAYNHLPEKVAGVSMHTIEKSSPLPIRLFKMFVGIIRLGRSCDVLYVQNGPSTELPAAIASFLLRKPFILRLGDEAALRFAQKHFLLRLIQQFAISRACSNIVHTATLTQKGVPDHNSFKTTHLDRPPMRPEILPFHDRPNAAIGEHARAWEAHTTELCNLFETCKK